jgi:hypothetical protein
MYIKEVGWERGVCNELMWSRIRAGKGFWGV